MRAAIFALALLTGCGGGEDAPLRFGPDLPAVVHIRQAHPIAECSTLQVRFDWHSESYFGGGGHFAVVLRGDHDPDAVRGHGLLWGRWHGSSDAPRMAIESWHNASGAPAEHTILAESMSPPLRDGVTYRTHVRSEVCGGVQRVGYQLYADGELVHDSGMHDDDNRWHDLAGHAGIAFGHVFAPEWPWQMDITNLRIEWSAP